MPQTGEQWNQLYRGATCALGVKAVREVIAASYDRILIDEYQDCHGLQHQLAVELSNIVPTLIFGDPMQGIFEFAGATLSWDDEIHPGFPFAGTLETPHRWAGKNPELGQWIAETRLKLMRGEAIDLADPRISYRESDDAFDMGTLFEGIDGKDGSFAAIHCNKTICYRLAKAANGGYQAIEEIAANRLRDFASAWDRATDGAGRLRAFTALIEDCFHKNRLWKVSRLIPRTLRFSRRCGTWCLAWALAMERKPSPRCSRWPANAQDGSSTAMNCGAMPNEQRPKSQQIEPRRWQRRPSAFASESATQAGGCPSALSRPRCY